MTSLAVSLTAATTAAALYAVAGAFQHRSTAEVRLVEGAGRRSLVSFARRTVRHRFWLLGTAASVLAVVLHALALHTGPLALVQPVMISGVLFALPLRARLDGKRIARRQMVWAVLLAAALTGFLVIATPASGTTPPADPILAAVVAGLTALCIGACLWAGRKARGPGPAVLLGIAAGLAFAGSAALMKAATDVTGHSLVNFWPLPATIVVGVTGLFVNQLAFQAGPLRCSLPAISTANPLASLVIGIVVYDEQLRSGAVSLGLELALLGLVTACAIALTRSGAERQPVPGSANPLGTKRAA